MIGFIIIGRLYDGVKNQFHLLSPVPPKNRLDVKLRFTLGFLGYQSMHKRAFVQKNIFEQICSNYVRTFTLVSDNTPD